MRRTSPRGKAAFSIIELLVSATIFLIIFGVGVWAVSRGFRMHAEASVRQSLQREVKAISAYMQEDGSKTNYFRTANLNRSAPGGEARDGLAMVALSSWQGNIPLDALGLPAWDNLIVYGATLDQPGLLLRRVIQPAATPIQDTQALPLLNKALSGTLDSGDTLLNEKELSSSVSRFEVVPMPANGLLSCELELKETHALVDGLGSRNETLDVVILLYPQNTWPNIR